MYKSVIALTLVIASISCNEDPFTKLEKHLTNTLAYHYLWPWNQLFKVATFEEDPQASKDPQIITEDPNNYEIKLNVAKFRPEDLIVKVKNRYIIVEGKREKKNDDSLNFLQNHFIMRFVIPSECKPDEVEAYWEGGILYLSAPKYDLPPPQPERRVPIEIRLGTSEKPKRNETEMTPEEKVLASWAKRLATTPEPINADEEDTTKAGKIRKKELKTKTAKENEVKKTTDTNGLDYALIEAE